MRRISLAAAALSPSLPAGARSRQPRRSRSRSRRSPNRRSAVPARAASPGATRRASTWVVSEGAGPEAPAALWEFDTGSGKKSKLFEPVPVKDRAGKERKLSPRGGKWSPRGDALLVAFDHDLWLLAAGAEPRRLTNDADDEEAPDVLSGRLARRVREEVRSFHARSARRGGDPPHDDGHRTRLQRQARLGLRGGAREQAGRAARTSGRRTLPRSPTFASTRTGCPRFPSWTSRP